MGNWRDLLGNIKLKLGPDLCKTQKKFFLTQRNRIF